MSSGWLLCIGLVGLSAVANVSAGPLGDSTLGTGTVLGNAMNPGPDKTAPRDPAWPTAKHTPTGQMFRLPSAMSDLKKAASGWEFSGQVEFGYLGGDADEENARFRMYQDIDEGAYLNNLSFHFRKGAHTIDFTAGAAGMDDQYYGVQFGRANAWKVKLFYSEIPHVFTDRYKSLWTGLGTGTNTLVPGLTPGGTANNAADNAAIAATALSREPATLALTRKRSGARVDLDLTSTWKAYLSYAHEKRKGTRPFGSVWGNTGGTAPMEIAEPIDYVTQDVLAGITHAAGLNVFSLRFSASLFNNKIGTLTFQEPYRIPPAQGVTTVPAAGAYTQGRFDLTPSNDAYNVRAEYTRSMPDIANGYLTAIVSAGTWRQDDTLIPYMITPNVTQANVTLLPGGNWDAVTALSRRSADAVINTRLADLTLSLNPSTGLSLKAKGRFYETDNDMDPFLAVNPNATYVDADSATAGNQSRGVAVDGVTGVWGRPLNDGSGQAILFGTNATLAGNISMKSKPYSAKQYRFGGSGDYRLSKTASFNASLERDTMHRRYRERERTWDDRIKLGYTNRGLGNSTLRGSYEFGRRRGNDYIPSHYDSFYSGGIFPMPTTAGANVTSWIRMNSGFRSYEIADRDQHVGNLRLDTMVRPNLNAAVSAQWRDSDYPNSPYGRKNDDLRSANVDLHYQPSPKQTIFAFYSYQRGRTHQNSISSVNANVTIGGASPLGVITPANAVAIGVGSPGTELEFAL